MASFGQDGREANNSLGLPPLGGVGESNIGYGEQWSADAPADRYGYNDGPLPALDAVDGAMNTIAAGLEVVENHLRDPATRRSEPHAATDGSSHPRQGWAEMLARHIASVPGRIALWATLSQADRQAIAKAAAQLEKLIAEKDRATELPAAAEVHSYGIEPPAWLAPLLAQSGVAFAAPNTSASASPLGRPGQHVFEPERYQQMEPEDRPGVWDLLRLDEMWGPADQEAGSSVEADLAAIRGTELPVVTRSAQTPIAAEQAEPVFAAAIVQGSSGKYRIRIMLPNDSSLPPLPMTLEYTSRSAVIERAQAYLDDNPGAYVVPADDTQG